MNVLFKRGAVSGLPAASAGEILLTTDKYRLYAGLGAGTRLLGIFDKIDGTTAPTVNDDAGDGFSEGSNWIDTTADKVYQCVDSTVGAAVWKETSNTAGGSGTVTSVTAGTGLSGGVITTTGTVAFDPNSLTAADPDFADLLAGYDASAAAVRKFQAGYLIGLQPLMPGGRLCAATAQPVGDPGSSGNLYYTPHVHDRMTLWDGTRWVVISFPETSLALTGGLTLGKGYDVFGYLSAGALGLEKLVWTDGVTRATAITIQDGRYCKSGDKTRLYLGSFYPFTTGSTNHDSLKRFVWNMYNRVTQRLIRTLSTDSWTYATAAYRQANADATAQVEWFRGLAEDDVELYIDQEGSGTGAFAGNVGIGISSTTVNGATTFTELSNVSNSTRAKYVGNPGIGYKYGAWLEYVRAVGGAANVTFFGDGGIPTSLQCGITGMLRC